jgi:hypothetical protein
MKLAEGKIELDALPKIKPTTPPDRHTKKADPEPAHAAD